jgi:hypothetical protein
VPSAGVRSPREGRDSGRIGGGSEVLGLYAQSFARASPQLSRVLGFTFIYLSFFLLLLPLLPSVTRIRRSLEDNLEIGKEKTISVSRVTRFTGSVIRSALRLKLETSFLLLYLMTLSMTRFFFLMSPAVKAATEQLKYFIRNSLGKIQ